MLDDNMPADELNFLRGAGQLRRSKTVHREYLLCETYIGTNVNSRSPLVASYDLRVSPLPSRHWM